MNTVLVRCARVKCVYNIGNLCAKVSIFIDEYGCLFFTEG